MTLSGNRDRDQRAEAARAAWKERQAARAPRRPWVLPLMIGISVAILVGAVIAATFFGLAPA